MIVSSIENLGFEDGSVATFHVDTPYITPREWSQVIGGLPLVDLFECDISKLPSVVPEPDVDDASINHSHSHERHSAGDKVRDLWAPDHIFHFDGGARWETPPVFTVITCEVGSPDAPGTEILDSAKLYSMTLDDGFWEKHGIYPDDLTQFTSAFGDSTYYREALPYMYQMASPQDKKSMRNAILRTQKERNVRSLTAVANLVENETPSKLLPLVQYTPLEGLPYLFIDGGARNSAILDGEGRELEGVVDSFRQNYLAQEELNRRQLTKTVKWAPGKSVIFPRIAHRALPGNIQDRVVNIAFLIQEPATTVE